MLDTLGLDIYGEPWVSAKSSAEGANGSEGGKNSKSSKERAALDALITSQLQARADARKAKDFATADAIRDALNNAGVVIEDGAKGSSWHLQ